MYAFGLTLVTILGLVSCAGDGGTEMATSSTAAPAGGNVAESTTTAATEATEAVTTAPTSTSTSDAPAVDEERVVLTDRLAVLPVDGGVYLLGNSMFATGVDVDALQAGIPERDVRFNYYDGHYTSLWYLIAEAALGPSEERPELVVWGFRPRYAMIPAFRQNRPNSTDLFEFPDPDFERLTGNSVENGDFITGPIAGFADSFIPLTTDSFADSGLAQLVVIWRPVNVAQGTPDPDEERFVTDALAYFDAASIPYIDFFHDDRLGLDMYGKGDHYNAAGMAFVTETLNERVRELLDL
jgi:hypothetical protein